MFPYIEEYSRNVVAKELCWKVQKKKENALIQIDNSMLVNAAAILTENTVKDHNNGLKPGFSLVPGNPNQWTNGKVICGNDTKVN